MEYLVKEGFKDAVAAFEEESGINPGVNMSMLDDQIKIRDAVEAGRLVTPNFVTPVCVCVCVSLLSHYQPHRIYSGGSGAGERCRPRDT